MVVETALKVESDPHRAANCCAFYELDWVRELAGNIFHPGGAELTRRSVAAMRLPDHGSIADLGCGTGTTAMLLAKAYQLKVTAIDLSAANLQCARDRAGKENLAGYPIRFIQADAARLPLGDGELDGVLAECTFSLFANKPAVLAEIRRVLKPGAALAITDMAIGGELPDDLAGTIAPWTCLVDARDRAGYLTLFADAGFEVEEYGDESDGLLTLLAGLKRKLLLVGAGALLQPASIPNFDIGEVRYWLNRIETEVEAGTIQYLRFNLRACSKLSYCE
jgi:arsenite methyltransferase